MLSLFFFLSSRRRHTRCALVTGVRTCALPICPTLGQALLGRDTPRYVATAALVTNMTVHFKWGRDRSLVWVTALDTGTPVADARVQISDSCTGELLAKGVTDRSGGLNVPAGLPDPETYGNCESESAPHPLIVTARKIGRAHV